MDDLTYWLNLGKRAKACKGFEPHDGMTYVNRDGLTDLWCDVPGEEADEWVPDLRDPGTVGHIEAMMRAALMCRVFVAPHSALKDGRLDWAVWEVADDGEHFIVGEGCPGHPTKAEAIIVAWEATP